MSWCTAERSNELSRARKGSHKRTRHVGDCGELALLKSLAGDDDILAGLIKQQELVDGLMKLLEISDASVNKATSLVEQLMGDNAKPSSWSPRRRRRLSARRCCMSKAMPRG